MLLLYEITKWLYLNKHKSIYFCPAQLACKIFIKNVGRLSIYSYIKIEKMNLEGKEASWDV